MDGVKGLYITMATGAHRFLPGWTIEQGEEAMQRGYLRYNAILLSTHGAIVEEVTIPAPAVS